MLTSERGGKVNDNFTIILGLLCSLVCSTDFDQVLVVLTCLLTTVGVLTELIAQLLLERGGRDEVNNSVSFHGHPRWWEHPWAPPRIIIIWSEVSLAYSSSSASLTGRIHVLFFNWLETYSPNRQILVVISRPRRNLSWPHTAWKSREVGLS